MKLLVACIAGFVVLLLTELRCGVISRSNEIHRVGGEWVGALEGGGQVVLKLNNGGSGEYFVEKNRYRGPSVMFHWEVSNEQVLLFKYGTDSGPQRKSDTFFEISRDGSKLTFESTKSVFPSRVLVRADHQGANGS